MADTYDNTNRGSLFKNDRKEQPTHADLNGRVNVNGVDYYLNAWLKESKTGKKFYSLSVKPVGEQKPHPSATRRAPAPAELDDEIPF